MSSPFRWSIEVAGGPPSQKHPEFSPQSMLPGEPKKVSDKVECNEAI